jgi:hypothetical protein
MQKFLTLCAVVLTVACFTLSTAAAADQTRTRDRKKTPKKDRSCQSSLVQTPPPSVVLEASDPGYLLAGKGPVRKSGTANGTKERKQDRKQDKQKTGTCRS